MDKKINLHSICSYFAMFPPSLPEKYIKKYTKKNEIVLDTFSGRGTTILEARRLNRRGVGIDLNPLSFVLSKAKSIKTTKEKVLSELKNIEKKYVSNEYSLTNLKTKEMKIFYHNETIRQLMFFRENYGKKIKKLNNEEIFILGILLGIMHGPERKDGSSMYLSVHTSNIISMSPTYANNWLKKHKKIKKSHNVFKKVQERINSKMDNLSWDILSKNENEIYFGDALNTSKYLNNVKVKLIITSPPYLDIVNYTKSNWKRLWLLGYDKDKNINDIKLDQAHKYIEYKNFIIKYLKEIAKILDNEGNVVLIIGDVRNYDYSFAKMYEEIKNQIPFILNKKTIQKDNIEKFKSSKSFGTRKGFAIKNDISYVLSFR